MDEVCRYWIQEFQNDGIDVKVYNSGYHLKVGNINFYPTKKSWYNEATGKKGRWENITDVVDLIGKNQITQEGIFNTVASGMLVNFKIEKFKEENWVLYKAIIQSMERWANQ